MINAVPRGILVTAVQFVNVAPFYRDWLRVMRRAVRSSEWGGIIRVSVVSSELKHQVLQLI